MWLLPSAFFLLRFWWEFRARTMPSPSSRAADILQLLKSFKLGFYFPIGSRPCLLPRCPRASSTGTITPPAFLSPYKVFPEEWPWPDRSGTSSRAERAPGHGRGCADWRPRGVVEEKAVPSAVAAAAVLVPRVAEESSCILSRSESLGSSASSATGIASFILDLCVLFICFSWCVRGSWMWYFWAGDLFWTMFKFGDLAVFGCLSLVFNFFIFFVYVWIYLFRFLKMQSGIFWNFLH